MSCLSSFGFLFVGFGVKEFEIASYSIEARVKKKTVALIKGKKKKVLDLFCYLCKCWKEARNLLLTASVACLCFS